MGFWWVYPILGAPLTKSNDLPSVPRMDTPDFLAKQFETQVTQKFATKKKSPHSINSSSGSSSRSASNHPTSEQVNSEHLFAEDSDLDLNSDISPNQLLWSLCIGIQKQVFRYSFWTAVFFLFCQLIEPIILQNLLHWVVQYERTPSID